MSMVVSHTKFWNMPRCSPYRQGAKLSYSTLSLYGRNPFLYSLPNMFVFYGFMDDASKVLSSGLCRVKRRRRAS